MADASLHQIEAIKDHAPIKRLSCLEAMRERRGEVVCFTPALLITHGGLQLDPAQDFIARTSAPSDLQPFCVELPPKAPGFFSGLPISTLNGKVIDWNRRLYAVPTSVASLCLQFLGGIGISGPNNYFASSVAYTLDIPDPLALDPYTKIPVHIFGVLCVGKITYLAPAGLAPPYVDVISVQDRYNVELGLTVNETLAEQFRDLRGDT